MIYSNSPINDRLYLLKYGLFKMKSTEVIMLDIFLEYLITVNKFYKTEVKLSNFLKSKNNTIYSYDIHMLGDYANIEIYFSFLNPTYHDNFTFEEIENLFLKFTNNPVLKLNKKILNRIIQDKINYLEEEKILNIPNYVYKNTIKNSLKDSRQITPLPLNLDFLKKLKLKKISKFYRKKISKLKFTYHATYDTKNDIFKNENLIKKDIIRIYNNPKYIYSEKLNVKEIYTTITLDLKILNVDEEIKVYYNELLGANNYSILFKKVREEDKLCYSISSQYLLFSNMIIIYFVTHDYKNAINKVKEIINNFNITFEDFKEFYINYHKLDLLSYDSNYKILKRKILAKSIKNSNIDFLLKNKDFSDENISKIYDKLMIFKDSVRVRLVSIYGEKYEGI